MLQRATRGLVWPVWTRTNRCHVLCGETKGCTRTKPHKATDINPYTVPLHWLLYACVKPSDPLTVKSATSQTAAFKQIKRQKYVKYSKEKRNYLEIQLPNRHTNGLACARSALAYNAGYIWILNCFYWGSVAHIYRNPKLNWNHTVIEAVRLEVFMAVKIYIVVVGFWLCVLAW